MTEQNRERKEQNERSKVWQTRPLVAMGLLLGFVLLMLGWHGLMQHEIFFQKVRTITQDIGMKHHTEADNEDAPTYPNYRQVKNGNMLAWDAVLYELISKSLYKDVWPGYFAFYPLFPILWRLTGCSPIGISILNYLMFCLGVGVIVLCLSKRLASWMLWLLLLLPCLTPYMVPYSESLFFVCTAVGLLGLMKDRYWVYFVGFMLASMTRAAGNIMLVAWVIVDLITFLYRKGDVKKMLVDLARHIAPIVTGIAIVLFFQHIRGAEHWFEYALAQKEWGKSLDWPTLNWTDWSREGKSISWPIIYAYGVPMLAYLIYVFVKGAMERNKVILTAEDIIPIFSVLFLVGNILLAMLTQHGCMYSQARLLTCTPFFVYMVLHLASGALPTWARWGLTVVVVTVACRFLFMFSRTYMMGIWNFVFLSVLCLWGYKMRKVFRSALLGVGISVNLLWQAQLFNIFLEESWLFM